MGPPAYTCLSRCSAMNARPPAAHTQAARHWQAVPYMAFTSVRTWHSVVVNQYRQEICQTTTILNVGYSYTVVGCADLYGGRAGALAARRRPGRHADVVDGVGREVVEPVRVDGRRDGDADVLAQVRVVVVELVRVDGQPRSAVALPRLVPRQLDRRRRRRLALQVRRLLRHCSTTRGRDPPPCTAGILYGLLAASA